MSLEPALGPRWCRLKNDKWWSFVRKLKITTIAWSSGIEPIGFSFQVSDPTFASTTPGPFSPSWRRPWRSTRPSSRTSTPGTPGPTWCCPSSEAFSWTGRYLTRFFLDFFMYCALNTKHVTCEHFITMMIKHKHGVYAELGTSGIFSFFNNKKWFFLHFFIKLITVFCTNLI